MTALISVVMGAVVSVGAVVAPSSAQAAPTTACLPRLFYTTAESGTVGTANMLVTNTCNVSGVVKVTIVCPGPGRVTTLWVWRTVGAHQTALVYVVGPDFFRTGCYAYASGW
jgi:hypothetical protein